MQFDATVPQTEIGRTMLRAVTKIAPLVFHSSMTVSQLGCSGFLCYVSLCRITTGA